MPVYFLDVHEFLLSLLVGNVALAEQHYLLNLVE